MDEGNCGGVGALKLDAEGMGVQAPMQLPSQAPQPDLSALRALQSGSILPSEDGFVLRVSRSGRVSKMRVTCQQESPLKGAPLPFTKKRSRGKRSGNSVSGDEGVEKKSRRRSGASGAGAGALGHSSNPGPELAQTRLSAGLKKSGPEAASSRGRPSRGQDRASGGSQLQADWQQQEDGLHQHRQHEQQHQYEQQHDQQHDQQHQHDQHHQYDQQHQHNKQHQQQPQELQAQQLAGGTDGTDSADAAAPDPGAPGQHKRSKASKSSGSQQQRKEQHQERQEGRVDLAAGQRSHSTAALEVTPLHDKAERLEEDGLRAAATETPKAKTRGPKMALAGLKKSEDAGPRLRVLVAGPSAEPAAAASDKQHPWRHRQAAPLTALNTGGTGLAGAAKRPQPPPLLKVRPSPRPPPEAKKQSSQGKGRVESGGDLSGHETSGGNPCDFYSSGAPSGGGHESSQGGKESNGAPSGGGARNSGAAMFALSRAQPGLFRVAGLRRNAGGAFKPVGKH